MTNVVHYVPIATTLFAAYFSVGLYKHWRSKPHAKYLMWWWLGVVFYGLGTLTESTATLFGSTEIVFKAWFILGALLGGAPLAQGSVYLLMKRRTADVLTVVLILTVVAASVFILMSPVDMSRVASHRLSGDVLEWQWVRRFSPFINTYAFIFLVGGAIYSAVRYSRYPEMRRRYEGNIYIAVGGLLPGIGGFAARQGYTEVLYIAELIGLLLIFAGYLVIRQDKPLRELVVA